jgi:hypothetical protein
VTKAKLPPPRVGRIPGFDPNDFSTFPRNHQGRRYDPRTGKVVVRPARDWALVERHILAIVAEEKPVIIRRIHYALVSRNIGWPNELFDYQALSKRVTAMRRDGRIAYDAIVDNTREVIRPNRWNDPAAFLDDVRDSYHRDPWQDLDDRVIVMVEKDALRGVLLPITDQWSVQLALCRGRMSDSMAYDIGRDIESTLAEIDGKVYVAYLGDHDSTGQHNPGDIDKRLREFLSEPDRMVFDHIGLHEAQALALGIPPLMIKTSDPVARRFTGTFAAELDAVPVPIIRGWVEEYINGFLDKDGLAASDAVQATDQKIIEDLIDSLDIDGNA